MNEEVDKILAKAMMFVTQTAANDGIITQEEKEMLDTFEFSLKIYHKALNDAFEDGCITKEEELQLERVKDMILNDGTAMADKIDGISKDEMNLLLAMMLSLKVPKADE